MLKNTHVNFNAFPVPDLLIPNSKLFFPADYEAPPEDTLLLSVDCPDKETKYPSNKMSVSQMSRQQTLSGFFILTFGKCYSGYERANKES